MERESETVYNPQNYLRDEGILEVLRVEAGGTNIGRMFCAFSEEGAVLFERFLGQTVVLLRDESQHPFAGEKKAVASVLITKETICSFCLYVLLERYENVAEMTDGSWLAYTNGDLYAKEMIANAKESSYHSGKTYRV